MLVPRFPRFPQTWTVGVTYGDSLQSISSDALLSTSTSPDNNHGSLGIYSRRMRLVCFRVYHHLAGRPRCFSYNNNPCPLHLFLPLVIIPSWP